MLLIRKLIGLVGSSKTSIYYVTHTGYGWALNNGSHTDNLLSRGWSGLRSKLDGAAASLAEVIEASRITVVHQKFDIITLRIFCFGTNIFGYVVIKYISFEERLVKTFHTIFDT